jgi:hypothetical protein
MACGYVEGIARSFPTQPTRSSEFLTRRAQEKGLEELRPLFGAAKWALRREASRKSGKSRADLAAHLVLGARCSQTRRASARQPWTELLCFPLPSESLSPRSGSQQHHPISGRRRAAGPRIGCQLELDDSRGKLRRRYVALRADVNADCVLYLPW